MQQHAYLDLHAWCFTPHSFRLILSDLFDLGLVPFRELAFFPTEGCEFFVTLGREGKGPAMDRQQMLEWAHAERCSECEAQGATRFKSVLSFLKPRKSLARARKLVSGAR
jgi:hypothetical protein